MNATQTDRLERLRNRATKYEAIAEHPDGRKLLIGYVFQPSRRTLMERIRAGGERLISELGIGDEATFSMRVERGAPVASIGEWTVRLTGRTQREAIGGAA